VEVEKYKGSINDKNQERCQSHPLSAVTRQNCIPSIRWQSKSAEAREELKAGTKNRTLKGKL